MEDPDFIHKLAKLKNDLLNDYKSLYDNTLDLDRAKAINKIARVLIKVFILQLEQGNFETR